MTDAFEFHFVVTGITKEQAEKLMDFITDAVTNGDYLLLRSIGGGYAPYKEPTEIDLVKQASDLLKEANELRHKQAEAKDRTPMDFEEAHDDQKDP